MVEAIARPAEHYETLEQQAHGARLGMAVFIASEALLFSALFTLFSAYQAEYPAAFHEGVLHNTKVLGSINTGVLLVSSTLAASAVHAVRANKRRTAALLLSGTIALGIAFLCIKVGEYLVHFHEGIWPGGVGTFFSEHPERGIAQYWTLYFVMTGLHAIHVFVGLCVLGWVLHGVLKRTIAPPRIHPIEIGTVYWHLVDMIWIFLWPLIYLA